MKTNIFIPKKINVGFQNRPDTYTKKLAYIIYFDEKGKLRKEASWNGWRDEKIDAVECDNVPTSGFVLNKKVGDYVSDWNHRQAYVRVYDPRDFEFEITIQNLLYLLENTSSIKGKGLEGEFVYGWDGKDLVLIPTSSPDYVEISKYNDIVHKKEYIKAKDLKLGAIYKTKTNDEYIYMGRFDYHTTKSERVYNHPEDSRLWHRYDYRYVTTNINKGKHYFFVKKDTSWFSILELKSLGEKFIEVVSEDCIENYAELFEKLECNVDYSPYDKTKDEVVNYDLEEFSKWFSSRSWDREFHYKKDGIITKRSLEYDRDTSKYYINKGYDYRRDMSNREYIGTVEDVFNTYQPTYKNEYLQNGKFYRRLN